jgi:hypothetical protein
MVFGTCQALPIDQVNVLIFIFMSSKSYLIICTVPGALWVMLMCWGPYLVAVNRGVRLAPSKCLRAFRVEPEHRYD